MENENRTDWTLPRKNLNPKTKQPYKRGRNWWIVVYPESLPENWKEIISTEPVELVHYMIDTMQTEKKKSRIII